MCTFKIDEKKLYFDIKTNKNCKQKMIFCFGILIRSQLTASTRCIEFIFTIYFDDFLKFDPV